MPAKASFGLYRDTWGRLGLIDSEGIRHAEVSVVRMFPVSDAAHWIAVCDAAGHEIVSIPDPRQLPPEIWETLQEELAEREFVPRITRILAVSAETDPCEWHVETDRGETRFELAGEDDVRALGPHRVLVADSHGVRYLVQDTRELDSASRRILERYL